MASTESLSRTIADTVTISRELREDGQIDGQVKLYNVDDEDEFEADADTFFERTLMTQGLREAFTDLKNSLTGNNRRGTYILYGPYGSGKSHQMVAMYHAFASPEAAGRWGESHISGFTDALPSEDNAEAVTVSLQDRQPDYLWEPFFEALDYDAGSFERGGYPDRQTILDAVGDKAVAYLVDELEDWFATLDPDREEANRGFLQSLLEAADDDSHDLYAIVSVLREGSKVHNILNREEASEVNMNNKVSKREVIRHRLIGDIDEAAVDEIVDGYVDAYASDHVDLPSNLADDMRETYPFHPVLLEALETRYYADEGNQNTRGMIYLFSKVLLTAADPDADPDDDDAELLIEQTDLVTHGDIDALLFEDELSRINFARPNVCVDDIEHRVNLDEIPYGRRILNTILLYSLKPDEGEGATPSDIVLGTYQTGDLVSDIVLNLERLYGVAWYLHKLNGKYAIRDRQNEVALIENEATKIDENEALAVVADTVRDVFGDRAYPVGFEDGDLKNVPDSREIKVVVSAGGWTPEDVETVIKNADGSPGREWRNTLIFVQPTDDKAIELGTGFIEKARYIKGAEEVLKDNSLEPEIRQSVEGEKESEIRELRKRVELAYGEILDGDDLLNDFEFAAEMDLDVFVSTGEGLNADDIAANVAAEGIDLQRYIWEIVDDLLSRRGEASIEDVYEQFLRQPSYPIPGSPNDVLNQTAEALEGKPVITHGPNGFSKSLTGISLDTTLLSEDSVERWTTEDVVQELRRRFGSGEASIDVGNFELELLEDTEVWLDGDAHDAVMTAVGKLAQEDQYVLYSGTSIVTKAQSDATLRDISEAETVSASDIRSRLREALEADGKADTSTILADIRRDETVYLPEADEEMAFREAVNDFLVDDYVLDIGREYVTSLGDRDPIDVVVVPTVSDTVEQQIIDHLNGLEEGDEFTVGNITDRFDATVTEDAVQTFLLQHLGRDEEPRYVVGPTGSDAAVDWSPGFPFRVPGEPGWRFEFDGEEVSDLRTKWRNEEQTGEVSYGEIQFKTTTREGIPGPLQGTAEIAETNIRMRIEPGEDYTAVRDLLERMPEDVSNISVEINFE